MINKDVLIREFTEAVQEMRRTNGYGTYYWILSEDNTNRWAIVLGWGNGFEEDPNDNNLDGTWRICAKMAYQPRNSIMQCDYDIDWLMPYDKETMEVDDNEVSIYPKTDMAETISWLLECYEVYRKQIEDSRGLCMKKYYSLVVSVLDEDENRVEAHEITGGSNKKQILAEREQLEKEIELGKYDYLNNEDCTLSADIEVHDDDTCELLYIM